MDEDGHSCGSAGYLFTIAMTLTEAGLAAGPGLGLAAAGLAFSYLAMLREAAPQEWVWRELKARRLPVLFFPAFTARCPSLLGCLLACTRASHRCPCSFPSGSQPRSLPNPQTLKTPQKPSKPLKQQAIAEMKFRFHEEEEAVELASRLAGTMHRYAPAHAVAAEWLHEAWDPALVGTLLEGMHPSRGTYRRAPAAGF